MGKEYPVGIDFGACNIKVAHYKRGQMRPLKLNKKQRNDAWTPTVIFYKAQEETDEVETLVGDAARTAVLKRPEQAENFIDDIKRHLELPQWSHDVPSLGRAITAQDAARDIFAYIHGVVQNNLDEKKDIEYAITVPVCFSAAQRHRLRTAAERAGLSVRSILTEPFAAIFSEKVWEKIMEEEERQVVVVCDFGGSTIDLSLLVIEPDEDAPVIREIGASGVHYGGRDIDARIESDVLQKLYGDALREIDTPEIHDSLVFEIHEAAAQLKTELCRDCVDEDEVADCTIGPTGAAHDVKVQFTHAQLRDILQADDVKTRLGRALDELFAQAGGEVLPEDVTIVRALGGTSFVHPLLEIVSGYFGERDGKKIFDPDDAEQFDRDDEEPLYFSVAQGAATYLQKQQDGMTATIEHDVPLFIGRRTKKGFVNCLTKGWRTNEGDEKAKWGKRKFVSWEDVAAEGGKITFYQRLSDAAGGSTLVYVGSVAIDRAKYQNPKGLAMYLRVQEDDTILARLVDLRPGEAPFEEILPVEMGDAADE